MSTMNIPDSAVEAACKAQEEAIPGAGMWDDLSEGGKRIKMDEMRPILEAAAPFILECARQERDK